MATEETPRRRCFDSPVLGSVRICKAELRCNRRAHPSERCFSVWGGAGAGEDRFYLKDDEVDYLGLKLHEIETQARARWWDPAVDRDEWFDDDALRMFTSFEAELMHYGSVLRLFIPKTRVKFFRLLAKVFEMHVGPVGEDEAGVMLGFALCKEDIVKAREDFHEYLKGNLDLAMRTV